MARKSKNDDNLIFILIAIIALLPVFILSFIFYKNLSKQYLNSENVQRVSDIKRLIIPLTVISSTLVAYCILFLYLIVNNIDNFYINITIFSIPIVIGGYFSAKYLAIMYLGVIFNFDKEIIICPYDLESYGIINYLTFNFIRSFTQVNSINVNEITKITRGYGNELYLHGKFGSNKICMSSKQKRDECLALAAELIGKKGITFSELESY